MAVSQVMDTNFRLVYDSGAVDHNGETIYKRRSYNNVKPQSTDEHIFQAANALASLCKLALVTIERDDMKEILA